jgi:outer membrane protein
MGKNFSTGFIWVLRRLTTVVAFAGCSLVWAQPIKTLTLEEAKATALRNHPRIHGAGLLAEAVGTTVAQARAAYYPTLAANLTGAGAPDNSAVAAGSITTSSLSSRLATGLVANQLITDFGRTSSLTATARLRAAAQTRNIDATKAQVLLQVEQAYYQALGAQSVLRAAQAALENRRLTLRQVRALAESSFKSTLDVSFAEVSVSAAELQMFRAENDVQAGQARLAAALGYETGTFELVDEPTPAGLLDDPKTLIDRALRNRPDLATVALQRDAAMRFADAEKRLKYPSVNLLGVTGEIPQHMAAFRGNYGAAGLNVNIPILNGGLYSARRAEADLRARAASDDVQDMSLQIARDVRLAWLEANTAFRRLDLTARMVAEADQALRLAQLRYDNGLGSIVELNQAQLNQTSAQIEAAGAKYDYLSRRAALDFAVGTLP